MSRKRPDPLSPESVNALLKPLEGFGSLLIAVSGGPDSVALLIMAAEWAKGNGCPVVAAATTDHGLRPESALEAAAVSELCRGLDVPHETLAWTGQKPATRIQERAREARYRLLIAHAKAIGAEVIVTAHHADDQAETVLFRLLRGSGVAGLAGMAPTTFREGVTIARPLLRVPKAALVAYCKARGQAFVEDPSNSDPRFARPRLRVLMNRLAEEGLDAQRFARLAGRAAEAEEAIERMTDEFATKLGPGSIDAARMLEAPIAVAERLLARRIAEIGGRDESRIGLEKIETLTLRLRDAAANGRALTANVGGALVRLKKSGRLTVMKEPPRRRRSPLTTPYPELVEEPAPSLTTG